MPVASGRSSAFGADDLLFLYERLRAHFGPRRWWPGETPLEVAVGAVLTQNTAWRNVERAIANLKRADVLTLPGLYALDEAALATLIRPAGTFNVKARRLGALLAFFARHSEGEWPGDLSEMDTPRLRAELLAIKGIGPETADSILLYAFSRASFVIDAYTKRIGSRLGFCAPDTDYHELQALFHAALPPDLALYNDFHAQFVALGHEFCKPKPRCATCPIADFCQKRLPGI